MPSNAPIDYEKLGFKCGIEIHQRLATAHKLFCACKAEPAPPGEEPVLVTKRRIRAVVGELGKVDPAAAFEQARGREFTYQSFNGRSCEVDRDEEPPRELNAEALGIALTVAKMLGAKVLDELHVMRKTVVDGSAVSGFQRTLLVAVNGLVETGKGPVGIPTICLEEESSGIVEGKGSAGEVTYRLDRLGIPLIEIATDPAIKDATHAKEVAEKIGMMLRNTGRVQRGIGTIRQDLNVSIREGARIEAKGAQELAALPAMVENEVRRQEALVEVKKELAKRGAKPAAAAVSKEVSKVFAKTNCGLLKKALEAKKTILALKLVGFGGLMERELMPDHRLGTEFSHYARAKAGAGGIIHSGENTAKYGISPEERGAVEKELGCGQGDAWAIVAESKERGERAIAAVFERANECFVGVPKETRRAEGEKTVFMRPLPGSARMYPETDVPPIEITKAMLDAVKVPVGVEEKKKEYLKMGLGEALAEKMLGAPEAELFARLSKVAEPAFVAVTLLETMKSLKRAGVATGKVGEKALAEVFALYTKGAITRSAVPEVVSGIAKEPGKAVSDVVKAKGLEKFGAEKLKALAAETAGTKGAGKEAAFEEIMRKHRLNVEARELKQVLG